MKMKKKKQKNYGLIYLNYYMNIKKKLKNLMKK